MPSPSADRTALDRTSWALPARYAMVVLDDFDVSRSASASHMHAAALRVMSGSLRNLVLMGPPGTGKTMLAAAICRGIAAAIDQRYTEAWDAYEETKRAWDASWADQPPAAQAPHPPGRVGALPTWINVPAIIVDMRHEMGEGHSSRDRLEVARSARGLVVLDDLGREKVSDWTSELVYVLVNDRYERMLPTLVTTNLTPEELAASGYWPAISRLTEDGIAIVVKSADQRSAARRAAG